jgi:hypothetical protein
MLLLRAVEDILGLQISVNNVVRMKIGDGFEDLSISGN